jgi:hypothetical protein
MDALIPGERRPRRGLVRVALAAALLAGTLGALPHRAEAAYKARVATGTLTITGDAASDTLALRLQSGSPITLEVDVDADGTAEFAFDRGTFTAITVDAGGGDDEVRIDQTGGAFADELVTLNGGDGADILLGGIGAETFAGGRGDDFVAGGGGSDRVQLGGGDDRFEWHPGDGSDVVEGQAGTDLMDFFGANIGETVDVSASGSRVRLARDVAGVIMDLDGVDVVGFHALGGADTITVGDLARTGTKTVDIDLSAFGGVGDAAADTVTTKGTEGADRVDVGSQAGKVLVSGLAAQVQVGGAEAAFDSVNVATLGGTDTVTTGVAVSGPAAIGVDGGADADLVQYSGSPAADTIDVVANGTAVSTIAAGAARLDSTAVESLVVLGLGEADTISATGDTASLTALTLDGGEGGDSLRGGNGDDVLIGGAGDDLVDGNRGADHALLGDGDDRFQWDPGDGSDTVDGEAGTDQLGFFGGNISESIVLSANGRRTRLTRDVAGVAMDIDVEDITVNALGGADTVFVDDLSGTGAVLVTVDLGQFGLGDSESDTVVTNGTSKRDVVQVTATATDVLVAGFPAQTRILGAEALGDTLLLQTLGGDDEVTVAPEMGALIRTLVNLGGDE